METTVPLLAAFVVDGALFFTGDSFFFTTTFFLLAAAGLAIAATVLSSLLRELERVVLPIVTTNGCTSTR